MSERKKINLFLGFIAVIMMVFAMMSEGNGCGGGDSIEHFLISKYSFKHPSLFLHHWGKPFFTLVSSPFSQFGFIGINIFNILCACFTCWLAYDLTVKWEIKNAWLAVFILLFAPIYFVCIISGLTEIFFATVLMFSLWLFQREKNLLSSIMISFLPFIRTEGIMLLPLFAILLIVRKEFLAVFLIATGTILYSIIGGFYYNDFLWIIHQNPYTGAEGIYGRGKLTFFISRNEYILGAPIIFLLLLGLMSLILKKQKASQPELILSLGSFIIYLIAHSVFWWKGLFGSYGLVRVMAGTTPMIVFASVRGYNFLMELLKKSVIARKTITAILLLLIIWIPFKQHHFPRQMDFEEISLKQAGNWIRNNYLDGQKIYCATPFMWQVLDKDPFDAAKTSDFYSIDKEAPEKGIPTGSIVIWDSHFSPNEGGVSLQKLTENHSFRQLNRFETDPSLVPKDKGRYEVYVFQKI